jgi:mono/diheme cytochrome c family protein
LEGDLITREAPTIVSRKLMKSTVEPIRFRGARKLLCGVAAAASMLLLPASGALAFPWSTDMYVGPQAPPLSIAPRVMPDGVLPVDGIHYNVHYGQPQGLAAAQAIPPMKLELMTVKMHNPLQANPDNLAKGKELFDNTCSPCHGIHGGGNGTVAHLLQHPPKNLLTGVSKNLPDGYIYGYIRNGGIWMPSYDDAMNSNERWQVVLYVRELERKYSGEATASNTPATSPAAEDAKEKPTDDSDATSTNEGSDSP